MSARDVFHQVERDERMQDTLALQQIRREQEKRWGDQGFFALAPAIGHPPRTEAPVPDDVPDALCRLCDAPLDYTARCPSCRRLQ